MMVPLVFRLPQFEQKGNSFIVLKVKELLALALFHFFLRLNNRPKFVMAKVLGNSFYFSHIKIDLLKCDPFFFCCTDIYVTKICSSYICVYVSVDISGTLIAENIGGSYNAVFVNIVSRCSHCACFENMAVDFCCKSR